MTRFSVPPSASRRLVPVVCCLSLFALVAGGCDTVAELSIQQRDFRGVVSDGAVNAGACAISNSDVQFRLTFVPYDGDGLVIAPDQQVNNEFIQLGTNFTEEDIEFVNSVLYPIPDVPCTGDAQCTAPFTCQSINPANPSGAASVCGMSVPLETLQRPLVYDEGARNKYIAILMDYSGSLGGVDENGNFDAGRATDPRDQRVAGARLFAISYATSPFGANSEACVVSFRGSDVGGVFFDPTPAQCMTDDFEDVSTRLSTLGVDERGASPLWSALGETIAGADSSQFAGRDGDRIIILFTDGPDDSSVSWNFDSVLQAATENGVTVHIVHLDNPPEGIARTGPIDEFARLACATGGSYQYATSPNDLRNYFDVLSNTVPSRYEVQGQVAALGDTSIPLAEGCYRLSTGVRVTLVGQTITVQFAGDKTDPATLQVIDDRLVVCKRPVPVPEATESGGGNGAGGSAQ